MKATAFEFRFRVILMFVIVAIGFWSPWIQFLHFGTRTTAWLWLGFQLGGLGISSAAAIPLVSACTILIATVAAILRVWGTAYLGAGTVNSSSMKAGPESSATTPDSSGPALADHVLADGPYRYVRNPLYIGTFLVLASVSVLMPPTGALFALIVIPIFLLRLILSEEAFLTAKLGYSYKAYKRAVPRLFPALRTGVPASGIPPHWGQAFIGELLPIGILLSFAILSWHYDSVMLERAILISFGVSLVARALLPVRASSE